MPGRDRRPAVWIDFENAPHVWILSRVMAHLREEGYPLILTARDFSCTVGLCRRLGFDARVIGRPGFGRTDLTKALRIGERALGLYVALFRHRQEIGLALSHGSRAQILAAHYLSIPITMLNDYEYVDQSVFRFADHVLMPFPIRKQILGPFASHVTSYPGLKENLYLCAFHPDAERITEIQDTERIHVLMRPEGHFTHYRAAQSEVLQAAILDYLAQHRNIFLTLLPRDAGQGNELASYCKQRGIDFWVPHQVLDGPQLIWQVDLVIGGGGTMTREAAVLGVPSYSFFAGRWGDVDRYLQAQGRLIRLAEVADVPKIRLEKRTSGQPTVSCEALGFVNAFVEQAMRK